jgi:hypothetical protein
MYNEISVLLTRKINDKERLRSGIFIVQTSTLLLALNRVRAAQSWSLVKIY